MIKLIIFDFDGTLGDTRRTIVATWQMTMRALNLPVRDEATIAATIGLTLAHSTSSMFPELTEEQVDECVKTYRRTFDENKQLFIPQLFPGVGDAIRILKQRGLTMSVASSRSSRSLNEFLLQMGVAEHMSYVLGADMVDKSKPDPEPVLKTLAALQIPAAQTLVVGDMPVDILMGKAAGAMTCGVTWGNATKDDLQEAGADYIIDDISELLLIAGAAA